MPLFLFKLVNYPVPIGCFKQSPIAGGKRMQRHIYDLRNNAMYFVTKSCEDEVVHD